MAGRYRPDRGSAGLAVSFAVTTFNPPAQDANGLPRLPYAASCHELADVLIELGYHVDVQADPPAELIGTRFRQLIGQADPGARIVHVLSHGELTRTRSLYVIGSDGRFLPTTEVKQWLVEVEDFPAVPPTLFLLDFCQAGTAALVPWVQETLDGRSRAWVIAACRSDEAAYDARFTRASAQVLDELRRGLLDVYKGHRYVPINTVATAIGRVVEELADADRGYRQKVIGNPLYITTPVAELELPFFPNPHYVPGALSAARVKTDSALRPYLDEVLDPAHWRRRSAGHMYVSGDVDPLETGCFSGRRRQLGDLATWLDSPDAPGLRIVTGSPGSGKSALLGVLVCAAHPELSEQTRQLWTPVFVADAPSVNPRLAAVHARQQGPTAVGASLVRQLGLDGVRTPADLLEAVRALPEAPVVVVDALDEAVDPRALLDRLLLPLALTHRADGRPSARLLVGVRHGDLLDRLAQATDRSNTATDRPKTATDRSDATTDRPDAATERFDAVIDLDAVEPSVLEADLSGYVAALLRLSPGYRHREYRVARQAFADAVAARLVRRRRESGQAEWGEFLVAALYAHNLLARGESVADPDVAAEIGRQVPGSLPGVLELDLEERSASHPLLRPVLATLARAQGQGMPLSVVTHLVSAATGPLDEAETLGLLDEARFYLRQTPDVNGSSLYRLFHQGLADYLLREGVRSGEEGVDADTLLDVLLAMAGPAEDRRWHTAEPYLLRHTPGHALDVGRLPELIADPELLVHADPRALLSALTRERASSALDPGVRLAKATYEASGHRHGALSARARRDVLSVDAARWGAPALSQALTAVPVLGEPEQPWSPVWASGSSLTPAFRGMLSGHRGTVNALECAVVGDRRLAVSGSEDATVRIWDLSDPGAFTEPMPSGQGAVVAMARTTCAGRPCVATVGGDGTVRLWDLTGRRPLGEPHLIDGARISGVAAGVLPDGRDVLAAATTDGRVLTWAVTPGNEACLGSFAAGIPVQCLTCATVGGAAVVVTGGADGRVLAWDLESGSPLGEESGESHRGLVTGVVCIPIIDTMAAVTTGVDGTVRVWDLSASGVRPLGDPLIGHRGPIRTVAASRGRPADPLGPAAVVVTGGDDRTVRRWDVLGGREIGTRLTGHRGAVRAVAVLARDDHLLAVSGGAAGTLRIWEPAETGSVGAPMSGHTAPVRTAVFTSVRGRSAVVTSAADGTIRCWDAVAGIAPGPPSAGGGARVMALTCVDRGGRPTAVSAHGDGFLRLWDLETMVAVGAELAGHVGPVHAVAATWIRDSPAAVTAGADRTVRLWTLNEESPAGKRLGAGALRSAVPAVACTLLGGRPVAITSSATDPDLLCWDLMGDEGPSSPLASGHTAPVRDLACTVVADRPVAVAAAEDGSVRLVDLMGGGSVLLGRHPEVRSVACTSLRGRPLAVLGGGHRLRIWDLPGRRQIGDFALPEEVGAVATDDSGRIAVGFGSDVLVLGPRPAMAGDHG